MPVQPWSAAQVLALAPDPGAARGARDTSWADDGVGDDLLWGLCRGSGAQPYRTGVDLTGPAYRCSCPSRKVPCKHAIGLLLRWAGGDVGPGEPPDWALELRRQRPARRTRDGPVDEDAARKRAQRRAERVAAGFDELDRWLLDRVAHGLAETGQPGAGQTGGEPFEAMAARLVDAQAGGAAELVRRAGREVGGGADWADQLLGRLAQLRLLVSGHRRLAELPAELAATVRSRIGFPMPTEQVLAGPRVRDRWEVLAHSHTVDERLITRRTWMRGHGGRWALLLAFAPPGQPLPADAVPGTVLDAELCFYPGAAPLRALIADRHGEPVAFDAPAGGTTVRAALAAAAAQRAADPWLGDVPVLLAGMRPSGLDHLVDAAGDALALRASEPPWWLLAATGGHPVTVAGELGTTGLRPLAAWVDGEMIVPTALDDSAGQAGPLLPPELVSAALVGTARRPWPGGPVDVGGRALRLAGPGGPGALLDAAGAALAYRRAGVVPVPDRTPDEPAPDELRPPVPPAAASRLGRLLTGGRVPGGPEIAGGMLADWLRAAADRGFLAPPPALPALLDLGRRQQALRPAVAQLAGCRGRWLAERRQDWAYLLAEVTVEPTAASWETGTLSERAAYLTALRHRDPAAGLALLGAGYDAEPPAERAQFLTTLANGLSAADEPLLERALDDRRREVRDVAIELLAELPGSGLDRRMAARARAAVRADGDRWVIEPPDACGPDMARDGVGPTPPSGVGLRAWLLEEIVARTPLSTWTGSDRPPTAMPVSDEWAEALHRGLARAAVARRDAGWAAVLVGRPIRPVTGERDAEDESLTLSLHELLPSTDLAGYVARRLRREPSAARRLLERVPGPWSAELADAACAAIRALARASTPSWHLRELCWLAATAMPVTAAQPLRELADALRARTPGSRAADTVAALAAALTFRHDMIEELR